MDDKTRRKRLFMGVAGLVGVSFAAYIGNSVILEPVRVAESELRKAASSLEEEKDKEIQFIQAVGRLNKLKGESLPADARDAERLYREWLRDLATRNGFSNLVMSDSLRPETRKGQWSSVSVPMEGETTMPGLMRFLHQFQQARLAHRLSNLQIKSSSSTSSPRMTVIMTAEGLTVDGAPERAELFPRNRMTSSLKADDSTIAVESAEIPGFPTDEEFLVRIEQEMMKVTGVSGNEWTVERGVAGTKPAEHPVGAPVELFPIAEREKEREFEESYADLLTSNPWLKPTPLRTYSPQIASISTKTISPGESYSTTVKVSDIDPSSGDPVFALTNAPDGMEIDASTGEVKWETSDELAPDTYTAEVSVTSPEDDSVQLKKELKVTVRIPNDAPMLNVAAAADVFLEREFTLTVSAEDDGPTDQLKYSLKGGPAGLEIDSTGQIAWTPPRTFAPGEYEVEITVTDSAAEPLTDSKVLKLQVGDDTAALTGLTGVFGSVGSDGSDMNAEAWFVNRATNSTMKLVVGDQLNVADVHVEITEVDALDRTVRMKDEAGIWLIRLGESVRDRKLIAAAEKPAAEPVPATDQDKKASEATLSTDAGSPEESSTGKTQSELSDSAGVSEESSAAPQDGAAGS